MELKCRVHTEPFLNYCRLALVGAFNQEKALVGAFSVIVQPVVEPMEHYTALVVCLGRSWERRHCRYWAVRVMCLLVNIYCLLSLLYLGEPSFLLRFEYSLCSSLTITGSVRGSFQVSRMDNKGKIRWDNGIINVISVKKENRDEASIFKLHWSWLFNPVYVLCNRVEVWDRLMLPVLLFLCVVLYHGVSQQQPAASTAQ